MKHTKNTQRIVFLLFFFGLISVCAGEYDHGKKYWVFFTDKKSEYINKNNITHNAYELGISQRALLRRAKLLNKNRLIDYRDLPVASEYIRALEELDLEPLAVSRWLNSVSLIIHKDKLKIVRSLPFVKKIQPVLTYHKRPIPVRKIDIRKLASSYDIHLLDYGPSYLQNQIISVPEVHDLGITGKGVLIGLIDTGFDFEDREVFSHIDIIDEYDFHWGDPLTANEAEDPRNQHNHGTQVLSVIGGFHEGKLIGPAYEASFALAKTEWIPTETRIEEDHWVEGIEWLESLGADVVSSSLGYTYFDDGFTYEYGDLDGNTCVTTIAADIAASKGVVVVTSAGNERQLSWHFITSPADGDSVIAVGAVYGSGYLASISSVGPTADGRIKPDVVAMGIDVVAVSPSRSIKTDDYMLVDGTSFSCPQAAGVCALVLQAHPELNPVDVRDAVRNTADRAESPDTLYGWGVVNAYEAVFYHSMIFRDFDSVLLDDSISKGIDIEILSRHGLVEDSVFFFYKMRMAEEFKEIKMFRLKDGDSMRFRAIVPEPIDSDDIKFFVNAYDKKGKKHLGPVGAPQILYTLSGILKPEPEIPCAYRLRQNYPNPFNAETNITFDISQRSRVKIIVYNLLGKEVIVLMDTVLDPGPKAIVWKGADYAGNRLSSGIYFCKMIVEDEKHVIKMILVN